MHPLKRRSAAVLATATARAEQLELGRIEGIEAGRQEVGETSLVIDEDLFLVLELGVMPPASPATVTVALSDLRTQPAPTRRVPDLALRLVSSTSFIPRATDGLAPWARPVRRHVCRSAVGADLDERHRLPRRRLLDLAFDALQMEVVRLACSRDQQLQSRALIERDERPDRDRRVM
jgi:hypothetical protein